MSQRALASSSSPRARLRHIADLGVRTRGFSFRNRGLPVPDAEPRVELIAPDGARWVWGPDDATERVEGDALDFCLVVTQRRDVTETALRGDRRGRDHVARDRPVLRRARNLKDH